MIENERQYVVTKSKLAVLAESLCQMQKQRESDLQEEVWQSDLFSIRYLMDELEAEIAEYEKLRAGQVPSLPLSSVLDDLPTALTRARIARGWTQRDLANTLGTTEQQVQKDERGGYTKASLARLRRVAEVLGMRLSGEAQLTTCESAGSQRPTAVAGPK